MRPPYNDSCSQVHSTLPPNEARRAQSDTRALAVEMRRRRLPVARLPAPWRPSLEPVGEVSEPDVVWPAALPEPGPLWPTPPPPPLWPIARRPAPPPLQFFCAASTEDDVSGDPLEVWVLEGNRGKKVDGKAAQEQLLRLITAKGKLSALLARPEFEALFGRLQRLSSEDPLQPCAKDPDAVAKLRARIDAREQHCALILDELQKMACRNGIVIERGAILDGLTGANNNPQSLGGGAGSVAASLYEIKYMGKETTDLCVAGPLFLEALRAVRMRDSKADDKGTDTRFAMNFAHHVINHASIELAPTQCASVVLGHPSGRSTHKETFVYAWYYVRAAKRAAVGWDPTDVVEEEEEEEEE